MGVGTSSATKFSLAGESVLAVLLVGILMGCMRQSPAAGGPVLASPAQVVPAPNSGPAVAPTPVSSSGTPAAGGSCECGDIPDMEERILEAQAVIPLYQAEINRLQANGTVPPYSSDQYNQFQNTLIPVLNALATKNHTSTFAYGETSMFCNVTPNPKATACMKTSTTMHENIHKAVCDQKGWSPISGTWKEQIGILAVYQNEIAAYKAEIDFLQPLLASLKQSCSSGWSGGITSTFKYHVESATEIYDRGQTDRWKFSRLLGQVPQETQGTWSGEMTMDHRSISDSSYTWTGDPLTGRCAGTVLKNHEEVGGISEGSGGGHANLMITVAGAVAHVSVLPNQNDAPGWINGWDILIANSEGAGNMLHGPCKHSSSSGSPNPVPGRGEPFLQTGVDFDAPVDPQHTGVLKGHLLKNTPGGGNTTLDWELTLADAPR
jgi:hypothetical protein